MIKMKTDSQTRKVLFTNAGARLIDNGIKEALHEIGKLVKKELSEGIKNPPKTGRFYRHKGRLHRASVPRNEYPANRSGKLRRSITFRVNSPRKMTIGLSADYAEYLEEGTRNMEKRKLLGFTIKKHRNKIRDIIRKNVNGELK